MVGSIELPAWANALVLAAAGVMIWVAGSRLSAFADAIAERTGLSRAFLGAAMLGGITSLPELSTTVTAAARGNGPLAVNNLIGGVAMQVAVLALADSALKGKPISKIRGPPAILLQGILSILVLVVVAMAIVVGEARVGPIGVWSLGIVVLSLGGLALLHRSERSDAPKETRPAAETPPRPAGRIGVKVVIAAAFVLVGGIVAGISADALSHQTGLGSNLIGFIFLALVTSLPEISTTVAAVRLGRPGMAFSNIFGTNVLDLSLIGIADLAFGGAPVLGALGPFSVVACLMGIFMTSLYLAGIVEPRDRYLIRWGPDSILVIIVYASGLALLFQMG